MNGMKTYIMAAMILFGCIASAQVGMGRNRTNTMLQQQHENQGRDKGPTPEEQLDKFMAQMTAQVELNGLQEAAVRNILKEQMRQNKALQTSDQPESEKQDEARQVSEKSDKEIKALLDASQLEKYEKMKQDMRSGKKFKKKKKKDASDEPQE